MDIYSYLKNDHQKVNKLLNDIFAADVTQQTMVFEEIMEELLAHTDAEEKSFYKALQSNPKTKDKVAHSYDEHTTVKELLNKLSAMTVRDAEWKSTLETLKEEVQHHIQEEEQEIFPLAQEVLSEKDAKDLADEMIKLKKTEEALPIS